MKLTVNDFISIKSAELELKGITLIIGEQAEGKSLLAKLLYYFLRLVEIPHPAGVRVNNSSDCIDEYKREFKKRFFYQKNFLYTVDK